MRGVFISLVMDDKGKIKVRIISLLKNKGSLYVGDIIKEMEISPKSGYKFINDLRKKGLLKIQPGSPKIILAKSP